MRQDIEMEILAGQIEIQIYEHYKAPYEKGGEFAYPFGL